MSLSTSVSAIDNAGTVFVYIPPNVVAIPRGFSVVNGTYNQIQPGNETTLSGIIQIANGSGVFDATGPLTYRTVTITAPPVVSETQEQARELGEQIPDAV